MNCRHCNNLLETIFVDLGFAPPSNSYLTIEDMKRPEITYPLRLYVCENCWLVQTEDYAEASELFSQDYAYFSSVSKGWLEHAKQYSRDIIKKLDLDSDSFVVEIASNDGYLLKNFVSMKIPCLGVEPTNSTADAAELLGVPVVRKFFGTQLGEEISYDKKANLIIGNNVYAHVPDINDFTLGIKKLLKEDGTVTLEFPHLLNLIKYCQFDTIYHEHYSYLSLYTVMKIFNKAGLDIYDVEKLNTHGGSLRIYGCHIENNIERDSKVDKLLSEEFEAGLQSIGTYCEFQSRIDHIKLSFIKFLVEQRDFGKIISAYGAAAKGNTLLNYSGIKPDLISCVYDAAPSKQSKYLPGSHIEIKDPEQISRDKPDFILILPWNIKDEIAAQISFVKDWSGKFIVVIPELFIC